MTKVQISQTVPASAPWVLAAEDDDDDFFFLQREVSKATNGVSLTRAKDGVEAMQYLQGNLTQPPALLITDLKMPGIDGFGLVAWVKANPQLEKVAVFIWSGSELPKDRERAELFAAGSYHPKGSSYEGLPALVTEVRGVLPQSAGI